jgi:hypothetical protein
MNGQQLVSIRSILNNKFISVVLEQRESARIDIVRAKNIYNLVKLNLALDTGSALPEKVLRQDLSTGHACCRATRRCESFLKSPAERKMNI